MKLAFIGFRHAHVMGLYQYALTRSDVSVVAVAEDDVDTVARLEDKVQFTHRQADAWRTVITQSTCEAVAIGDYYGRRGEIAIAALEAGKHVIADKPICTRLAELQQIESLARRKGLSVGCLLDLRDNGALRTMRRIIRQEHLLGEIHTVNFTAQHPLLFESRPRWYFEAGKHGGTINDIAVHAIDIIPWMTGRTIERCVAARAWNARLPQVPSFQDAGQLLLALDNDGGVLGDVSYLAPEGAGYEAPQYWRITCHGTKGVLEGHYNARHLTMARHEDDAFREVLAEPSTHGGVFDAFLRETRNGQALPGDLTTGDVLDASRKTLLIQHAADQGLANLPLTDST